MTKKDKKNAMLNNAIQGLEQASNVYSRLGKITNLMPLIKDKSELVKNDPSSYDSITYCDGFLDGYESRINSVWHNITEEPKPGSWIAILTCNVYIKSVYSYKDICRYMRVINAKGWAYIEDLIPNTEE